MEVSGGGGGGPDVVPLVSSPFAGGNRRAGFFFFSGLVSSGNSKIASLSCTAAALLSVPCGAPPGFFPAAGGAGGFLLGLSVLCPAFAFPLFFPPPPRPPFNFFNVPLFFFLPPPKLFESVFRCLTCCLACRSSSRCFSRCIARSSSVMLATRFRSASSFARAAFQTRNLRDAAHAHVCNKRDAAPLRTCCAAACLTPSPSTARTTRRASSPTCRRHRAGVLCLQSVAVGGGGGVAITPASVLAVWLL